MTVLKRFITRFPGSSFPAEIETVDGRRAILKMKGAGNGVESLAAEFIVNRAAHALGWNVPDAFCVGIPADTPWEFGTDEFDDIVQKSAGVNLGLEFLGPCAAHDAPPAAMHRTAATLDAVFVNVDRRIGSANVLCDTHGAFWLVDHGGCRFLDPDASRRSLELPAGHVLAAGGASLIDRGLAAGLIEAARTATDDLPRAWLDELGWNPAFPRERLGDRLDAIRAG